MDKYLLHYSGRNVFSTGEGVDYLSTHPLLLHNHPSPVFYTHNPKCLEECLDHQAFNTYFVKSTNFQYTAIQIKKTTLSEKNGWSYIKFGSYLEWSELKHKLINSPGVQVEACTLKGAPPNIISSYPP